MGPPDLPLLYPFGWRPAQSVLVQSPMNLYGISGAGVTSGYTGITQVKVPQGMRFLLIAAKLLLIDDPQTTQVSGVVSHKGTHVAEPNGLYTHFAANDQWNYYYRDFGAGSISLLSKNITGTTEQGAAPDVFPGVWRLSGAITGMLLLPDRKRR